MHLSLEKDHWYFVSVPLNSARPFSSVCLLNKNSGTEWGQRHVSMRNLSNFYAHCSNCSYSPILAVFQIMFYLYNFALVTDTLVFWQYQCAVFTQTRFQYPLCSSLEANFLHCPFEGADSKKIHYTLVFQPGKCPLHTLPHTQTQEKLHSEDGHNHDPFIFPPFSKAVNLKDSDLIKTNSQMVVELGSLDSC